jgi:hypothetical protein
MACENAIALPFENLLVGGVGLLENLFGLGLDFGTDARVHRQEFDQVFGLAQIIFDLGNVREIILTAFSRDGMFVCLLDERAGEGDPLCGGDETGHWVAPVKFPVFGMNCSLPPAGERIYRFAPHSLPALYFSQPEN